MKLKPCPFCGEKPAAIRDCDEYRISAAIISHYGAKHQLLKLAEECAELIQQCMKCFDLDLQYSEDFIEELADVKVMLMQFESILSPAFAEMYERIITEKLDRQLKRMEVQSG